MYMWWDMADEELPTNDRQVLCVTRTKKGKNNIQIGYYSPDFSRWVVGMTNNVVAWMELPELPEGMK